MNSLYEMFKPWTAVFNHVQEFLTSDKTHAVIALNSFKYVPRVFFFNRIIK